MTLLSAFLKHFVQVGSLTVTDCNGAVMRFEGKSPGMAAAIRLHDRTVERDIALRPRLSVGEAYMDGRLTMDCGTIYDFLDFSADNIAVGSRVGVIQLAELASRLTRAIRQYNPAQRSRRNVAHHYDLNGKLYDLFLDSDRQYSCAYFADPEMTLEEAQAAKRRHLASKLLLKPGQKVLDIGCGWGGLALDLARMEDVEVTGVTLSTEQHAVATARARAEGLDKRVRFELRDYRHETGVYDRIVSVGMFEHVGVNHYATFMSKVRDLLKPDGVALLHSIGRSEGPGSTNPWIARYIFPGGYSPALSEVVPHVERAGLWITDVEILRLHYAETLKAWRARFGRHRAEVRALYDERFCRMWEFYLAGAEVAFRKQGHMNFQIQMARDVSAVPLTRDYMFDWERSHGMPAVEAPPQQVAAQ